MASLIDLGYVGVTIGFFALMLAFVRACAALGEGSSPKDGAP